jgi:hypothetical protein
MEPTIPPKILTPEGTRPREFLWRPGQKQTYPMFHVLPQLEHAPFGIVPLLLVTMYQQRGETLPSIRFGHFHQN